MDNKFVLAMVVGAIGGALIIANSQKARQTLEQGQNKIKSMLCGSSSKSNKKN